MGDRVIDRISESRTRLFDALAPLLAPGRVSKYVPKQVVTPTIWIERHSWNPTNEGRTTLISVQWRIVISTDSDDEQALLDTLSATVHDAIVRARFRPSLAQHQPIDIGGVSTTALVVTVEDIVTASTLCYPPEPVPVPVERISA